MRFIGKLIGFVLKVIIGIVIGLIILAIGILAAPYIAAALAFFGSIGLIGWLILVVFMGDFFKAVVETSEK